MKASNANQIKKNPVIKGYKIARFKAEGLIYLHIVSYQNVVKIAFFGLFSIGCSEKQAFYSLYSRNNQKISYRRKLIYVLLFCKNSEIKISYIKTLICLNFGYNGYSNKIIIEIILLTILFQEALYA